MDLRQLRQFVAVAEELNFRRAAQRLHISQPPLSAAVQRLEKDIGAALFERDRQHVKLTAAGIAFLDEARQILAHARLSVEIAQRAAAGLVGTLRLCFVPSAAYQVLPELLLAFRRNYPDVKLILTGETSARQATELLRGSVDLAIVVPPLFGSRDLRVHAYREEDLVLAVPRDHPLGVEKSVSLRHLAKEDFVGFDTREGPAFGGLVLAAFQKSGFIPKVVQTAPQMISVLALVAGGVGIALVPSSMQAVQMPHVRYVQVRQARAPLRYAIALAHHAANDNPVIPPFLATASKLAAQG
jgi:DNA-binding transcriptional LysR family regulator